MTVGDHRPDPDNNPNENREDSAKYELIYEVSERAKAIAPTLAGLLRGAVMLVTIPAVLLVFSSIFPILGTALIAKGASGWSRTILFALALVSLLIGLLFWHRMRLYNRAIRQPDFVEEVAQLVDIADMSDEFVDRIRQASSGGLSFKRLRQLWKIWKKPSYFSDRIKRLKSVRIFVPPRINFNIKLAFIEFWAVTIMWAVLIIALIARLAGSI